MTDLARTLHRRVGGTYVNFDVEGDAVGSAKLLQGYARKPSRRSLHTVGWTTGADEIARHEPAIYSWYHLCHIPDW